MGFDQDGSLHSILAEITNTPWAERHAYVIDASSSTSAASVTARFSKSFHVSPFHDMDQAYEWTFEQDESQLAVRMLNREGAETVFRAGLHLDQR